MVTATARGPQPGPLAVPARPVLREPSARRGARARGSGVGARTGGGARGPHGRRPDPVGLRGQRARAAAEDPRPLGQPCRRGRVPSELARAHGHGLRAWPALPALGERPAGRARRARRAGDDLGPVRGRPRVPRDHDVRRRPRAALRAAGGRRVRPPAARTRLRPRAAGGQGVGEVRHGDDREAGRLRRPREHDTRRAAGRGRLVRAHRSQVVLSAPMCDLFLVLAQAPEGITRCPASCPTASATPASRSSG